MATDVLGLVVGVLTTGDSVSFTVIVNEQVSLVPSSLLPVTTTVVVPTGKNVPDAWLEVTVPQFPVYVGAG